MKGFFPSNTIAIIQIWQHFQGVTRSQDHKSKQNLFDLFQINRELPPNISIYLIYHAFAAKSFMTYVISIKYY